VLLIRRWADFTMLCRSGYDHPLSALRMASLHTKCAACVHFCGQPFGGNGFCRIWSTILSGTLTLPLHCPHWSSASLSSQSRRNG